MLGLAMPAGAGEVPCPDPLPPAHDNATEYRTKQGPGIYTVRWSNPNAVTGDVVSCHVQIGAVFLFSEPDPTAGACFEEDVSSEQGRHPVEMWCVSIDDDEGHASTTVRLRIPGKPPKLY
jgi:hypothetical protein